MGGAGIGVTAATRTHGRSSSDGVTPVRDGYSTGVLGLTPEEGISGRHAPTEVPCRASRTLGDAARSGDAPVSEANVRAEGPHIRGERARVLSRVREQAPGRVTPGAKNQSVLEPVGAKRQNANSGSALSQSQDLRAIPASEGPPKTSSDFIRVVGSRVDALVIAFKVELPASIRDELEERQAIADEAGVAELRLAGLAFAMKRSRRRDAIAFENDDVRCVYDARASGGWCLEVVTRAVFLATHPLVEAILLAERIAAGFGTLHRTRLRRFDVAADFSGFPLSSEDADRIVTTRARTDSFLITDSKDIDEVEGNLCRSNLREHRSANREVTGFTVAPGNPLSLRIYNKTVELSLPGRDQKRTIEHESWRRNGWDGASEVVRVEYQCRGTFLDDVELRNPHNLENNLDGVWQNVTRWARIVDPTSASRTCRCALDPRWQAVTGIVFRHVSAPVKRKRVRGGATPEQGLGAVLSRLAATGQLPRIELVTPDGEVAPNESEFANAFNLETGGAFVREYFQNLYSSAADDTAANHLRQHGANSAVLRIVARNNAAIARFSSSEGSEGEP
jgi:hypothetical protein